MQTFYDLLPESSEPSALPSILRQQQAALRVEMTETPLPSRKTEAWKYSSKHLKLSEKPATALRPTVKISDHTIAGLTCQPFSELNDADSELVASCLSGKLDLPFAKLALAARPNGLLIRVAANTTIEQPLELTLTYASGGFNASHVVVVLESNAALTLIEQHSAQGECTGNDLRSAVLDLELGANSQLTYISETDSASSARQILATTARLQRDARLYAHACHIGTALGRHDFQVQLLGAGAECELNGICLTQQNGHFDMHTCIEHIAPNCKSNETYRCIADDQSHIVFNGRIHIHPDAQKTIGAMSNKNLLLSAQAEIDAKPELEIYADDVKCAHGTTIGKLNDKELYYLQTRGIALAKARQMLTLGFLLERVRAVPVPALSDRWETLLTQRLGSQGE